FYYLHLMKNLQLILSFLFFLFARSVMAQYDPSKVNPKARDAYEKALEKAQDDKYKEAIESIQEALRIQPNFIDAYITLGGLYGQIKDHENSIASYEKAFAIDSNYTAVMKLPYAINLAGLGQFEKALNAINSLLLRSDLAPTTRKAAEYRKKTFQFAIDFAKSHPQNYVFAPHNLGDGV